MSNAVLTVVVGSLQVAPTIGTLTLLQGTLSINQQVNQSSSASFTLRDLTAGANRPTVGTQVSISQDGTTLFVGFLMSFIENEESMLSTCQYQCTCVDWSGVTDRRVITTTYTSGTVLQTAVQDIVTNFLNGDGVSLAADFDGSAFLPSDQQFNPSMVRDALNQLCAACNRQWWIDNQKKLHFLQPGFHYGAPTPNPFNIASNDGNWVDGSMKITRSAQNFRDQQYIQTSTPFGTVSRTETFTTHTSFDFFLVTQFALESAPTVTVNGVPQTIYQLGVDPFGQAGWYWIANGYGVQQGQQIAPAPGSTVVVTYGAISINYIVYTDATKVAARAAIDGTSGIWANIANVPQAITSDIATGLAQGMVKIAGVIPNSVTFQTYRQDAVLGAQIFANIPERGLNGWFTVMAIQAQAIAGMQGVPSSNFTNRTGPTYGGVAKGVLFTITMNDAQSIGPFPLFFQQLVASIGGLSNPNAGNAQSTALAIQAAAGALANVTQLAAEVPAGTINSSNTAFTLQHNPNPAISLQLYQNGVLQIQGTDYTLSGANITFTNAPTTGSWLYAFYRYGVLGPAAFSFDETPGGAVNGSNVTFTLANSPSPSSSLQLYLNGILQLQATDYTISGSTITFTNAPNTGDELIAYYGFAQASQTGNFADDETPSGTVNGSNVTFTLAHPPSPASSLLLFENGVLQLKGTDYTLSNATITFTNAPSTGALLTAYYRF